MQYKRLILANKAWAKETSSIKPDYFDNLASDQTPEFLWIGCSDSRVPAEEITGARPGEIFVHRNIANLVYHNDHNVMSVLQYATEVLKVKHVIVCGHYGCGGVRAAATKGCFGIINHWVSGIKETASLHEAKFKTLDTLEEKVNLLVKLNVEKQVRNIASTAIVQKLWSSGAKISIHGWIFNIKTGMIEELMSIDGVDEIPESLHYEF